jgi:hypothetical protein
MARRERNMYVDHNPDDLGLISRKFKCPFERLKNIQSRLSNNGTNASAPYFDMTIGSGHADKYMYELYYDMIFMRSILAKLGVIDKVSESVSNIVFDNSVDQVVNRISENILKEHGRGTTDS